jgi:PII-like signaling protein
VAAVDALHRHGADAATVLLGVDGVLDGERRRARFVAANRGVPAVTVAVGARDAIEAALAEVGDLANLVTIEGGAPKSGIDRLSRPGGSDDGARVTLVTSEIARGDAGPRYLEFVHALRREGAAGATALRGVWGFRGDVAPHGDRVLALRRDVPLIVETVDTAERSERWLELARSLAGKPDVVYSQRSLRIGSLD